MESKKLIDNISKINIFMETNTVFASSIINIGYNLYKNNQIDDAYYMFDKAFNINNKSIEAYYGILLCIKKNKNIYNKSYIIMDIPEEQMIYESRGKNYYDIIAEFMRNIEKYIDMDNFFYNIISWIDNKIALSKEKNKLSLLYCIKGEIFLILYYTDFSRVNLEEAYNSYNKSISLTEKGSPCAWIGMAEINYLLGNNENALYCSDKAIELNNKYSYAYIVKGIIMLNAKDIRSMEYINNGLNIKLSEFNVNTPADDIKNFIVNKINEIRYNNININDFIKRWKLSCYYLGYCPIHPYIKSYFTLRNNKRLVISHYIDNKKVQHS